MFDEFILMVWCLLVLIGLLILVFHDPLESWIESRGKRRRLLSDRENR